jgi:hypothetical protein
MFGDCASLSYEPPDEKMVVAKEHSSFARPLGYDLVWEMKKGDSHFYAWRPRPPQGITFLHPIYYFNRLLGFSWRRAHRLPISM